MKKSNNRKKEWLAIIGAAVLLHGILFLTIRQGFFSAFQKSIADSTGDTPTVFSTPYAILTIPIEIEDSQEDAGGQRPVDEEEDEPDPPEEISEEAEMNASESGSSTKITVDLEELVGKAPPTRPSSPGSKTVSIPPRPIEITWPDTRKLKHCLGHYIDVKIHVSATGKILDAQALGEEYPADCLQAALDSATQILFEPGQIDGRPSKMWTLVRIDFRRKSK